MERRIPLIEGGTVKIPLTKGHFAIIDREDLPRVANHSWYTKESNRTCYAKSRVSGKLVSMHRFIFELSDPSKQVDHIDGNGLNNTRANLRLCNKNENAWNMRNDKSTTSSVYRGVSFNKRRQKWHARIKTFSKDFHIGFFTDETAAAVAWDAKAKELHREFAILNFPETSLN